MTTGTSNCCLSRSIVTGASIPPGGAIAETPFFHAHQDVAYPVPGFVIVAARRHIQGLDELTGAEAHDLIDLMRRIRQAQRAVLGRAHVYYFYNEDTTHHLHVWMIPRYPWMQEFGRSIESVRPALRHAQQHHTTPAHEAAVARAAEQLRAALQS
jgi:diadenosine tetraphosphate (Ap4A) HIT family hydrolase